MEGWEEVMNELSSASSWSLTDSSGIASCSLCE